MANYCVTFRIADKAVGGKTSVDRRQALIDNADDGSEGYWEETTSFLLVGSRLSIPTFTLKICKGLSAADDMVIVFDPRDMSAAYFGAVKHVDVVRSFFPKLKKLR